MSIRNFNYHINLWIIIWSLIHWVSISYLITSSARLLWGHPLGHVAKQPPSKTSHEGVGKTTKVPSGILKGKLLLVGSNRDYLSILKSWEPKIILIQWRPAHLRMLKSNFRTTKIVLLCFLSNEVFRTFH